MNDAHIHNLKIATYKEIKRISASIQNKQFITNYFFSGYNFSRF